MKRLLVTTYLLMGVLLSIPASISEPPVVNPSVAHEPAWESYRLAVRSLDIHTEANVKSTSTALHARPAFGSWQIVDDLAFSPTLLTVSSEQIALSAAPLVSGN
jgi:hypothetical protein